MDYKKELEEHIKTRPELPRPVPDLDHPAWKKFHAEFTEWAQRKSDIESYIRNETIIPPKKAATKFNIRAGVCVVHNKESK